MSNFAVDFSQNLLSRLRNYLHKRNINQNGVYLIKKLLCESRLELFIAPLGRKFFARFQRPLIRCCVQLAGNTRGRRVHEGLILAQGMHEILLPHQDSPRVWRS